MNLGMGELILIFIVALLVFGPKKLPELGKTLGRAMHEFKKATNELKDNLETEVGTAQIKEELLKQQRDIQTSLGSVAMPEYKQPETEEAYAAGSAEVKTETAAASTSEAPAEEKKPETSEASKNHAG